MFLGSAREAKSQTRLQGHAQAQLEQQQREAAEAAARREAEREARRAEEEASQRERWRLMQVRGRCWQWLRPCAIESAYHCRPRRQHDYGTTFGADAMSVKCLGHMPTVFRQKMAHASHSPACFQPLIDVWHAIMLHFGCGTQQTGGAGADPGPQNEEHSSVTAFACRMRRMSCWLRRWISRWSRNSGGLGSLSAGP